MDAAETRERIERGLGEAPPPPPLEPVLLAGRRVVRRRRAAAGLTATAVAAVAIGAFALAPGGADQAGVPIATQPTTTATASATTTPAAAVDMPSVVIGTGQQPGPRVLWDAVQLDETGQLVLADGVEVLQKIEDPFDVVPAGHSVGVAALVRGWEVWFALYADPDGSGNGATVVAANADDGFRSWVDQQSGIAGQDSGSTVGKDVWPGVADLDLVEFDGDTDVLTPVDGVEVLEQRGGIDVGESWAGPQDRTAAADVTTADGERYYVLARSFDGKPGQYIAVPHADGGADLDAFLDLARERYAEGGGGLL